MSTWLAERRLTILRAILAGACLLTPSLPALAADAAERAVHGFSSEGRYFAFEQYGIQDGSGFPYSDIFVVDLEHDQWVDGSPIRILHKDERHTLGAVRREAMSKARPLLDKLAIGEPGVMLATNSIYQANDDPRRALFVPYYRSLGNIEPVHDGDEDAVTLTLEEIVLPSPPDCPIDDTPKVGFVLRRATGSEKPSEVFRDRAIPGSRGCALAYSISDIIAFGYEAGGYQRYVALINVFAFGFEGANRRFLAVAFR
jgi:predicted secreted protein